MVTAASSLDAGGVLGDVVGRGLARVFSPLGATLILLALFLTGITLFTSLSWFALMDTIGYYTLSLVRRVRLVFARIRDYQDGRASLLARGLEEASYWKGRTRRVN